MQGDNPPVQVKGDNAVHHTPPGEVDDVGAGQFSEHELTFKPVTIDEWEDLQLLFAEPGVQHGCWCVYWRIKRSDFHGHYGEGNKQAMKRIAESGKVSGILAYLDGQPIGWCSVAPREEFPVLDRSPTLKRVDGEAVWSIVCLFVSRQYRRKGLSKILLQAAIDYAKDNGATIIEAYPLTPDSTKSARHERYIGLVSTFEEAGFREAVRRSERRPIMRYYVQADQA
jgi:GNAT superfamily N-acetyltransferase